MEQMDGRQINLGLSQLNTRLGDLFQTGISSVITNNELVLKENNIQLSSLAEPEAIVQSGQEVSLDIGSDIPYASSSLHGAAQTQWKFAGLKIKVKLVRRGNALRVSYSTSFTRPSQGQTISGNRESSTLMVPLNIPLQLFQVSFQTLGEQKQNIPILGSIPILGKIFSSTGSQANYKNITGVLQIEKYKL
jgi:type II secretory pathway component HofQ